LPLVPDVMEIHAAAVDADHVQPGSVNTAKRPSPPAAGTVDDVGSSRAVHSTVPAWVSACDWPPTTIVAVLASVLVFAWTVYTTSPGPLPPSAATEIQGAPPEGAHLQSAWVRTLNRPSPPPAGIDCEVGFNE
jgi:hypothetical protein